MHQRRQEDLLRARSFALSALNPARRRSFDNCSISSGKQGFGHTPKSVRPYAKSMPQSAPSRPIIVVSTAGVNQ
jgi:hypothetical protein